MRAASLVISLFLFGVLVEGGKTPAPRPPTQFSFLSCGYCCNLKSFARSLGHEELAVLKSRCAEIVKPGENACMFCCIPNFEREEKPDDIYDWIRREKQSLAQLPFASHLCTKDTCTSVGIWHPEQSGIVELMFEGLIFTDEGADNAKLQQWARTEFGDSVISKKYLRKTHVSLLVSLDSIPKKQRDRINKACAETCEGSKGANPWMLQPAGGKLCGRASIRCRRKHVANSVRMITCNPGRAVYQCSGNVSKMSVSFLLNSPTPTPSPTPSTTPIIRWMLTLVFDGMPEDSPHASVAQIRQWIHQETGWTVPYFFNWRFANGDGIIHYSPPRMPQSLATVMANRLEGHMYVNFECEAFVEPYNPVWIVPLGDASGG